MELHVFSQLTLEKISTLGQVDNRVQSLFYLLRIRDDTLCAQLDYSAATMR
jgi:hypothetical protein